MATKQVRAWVDDDDTNVELKPFQRNDVVPAWAAEDVAEGSGSSRTGAAAAAVGAIAGRKRPRVPASSDDDHASALGLIDTLLASTAPLLTSKHQRKRRVAPRPLSTVFLEREPVRSVAWHPSGDVLIAACSRGLKLFHCSGSFVDPLHTVSLQGFKRSVVQSVLSPSGDEAVVLLEGMHWPVLANISTGRVSSLEFLSTRNGEWFKRGKHGKSTDAVPSLVVLHPAADSTRQRCAVASGSTIAIASLALATVNQKIVAPEDVTDCAFDGDSELLVTARHKMYVYDVRNTARCVRSLTDSGSLLTTRLAQEGTTLALGAQSGVVNLYTRGSCDDVGASAALAQPTKTLMNLTTAVTGLVMSRWEANTAAATSGAPPMLAVASNGQANGFRLVTLPTGTVVPSFPEIGMKHAFVQCMAFHPTLPIFSVGEQGRIVNYSLLK